MSNVINSVQRYVPSSGGTVTILDSNDNIIVFLDQGSTLSTLTINWPVSPFNGQSVTLISLGAITSISNSGASFNNAPVTMPTNQGVSYIFDLVAQQWNFCGAPQGGTPGGSSGQVQYNNSGSFGGFTAGGDIALNTSTGSFTVQQINGAAIPASKTITGTNASNQIVDASTATLSNSTTGTAANITATSNSTLTTLSALSLPLTQTTGTLSNAKLPAVLMTTGLYASIPGSPSQGQFYYATDLGTSGCLLIYNSSKWMPVGGSFVLYNDTAAHTAAGVTTETNYAAYKIPAGLLSTNGSVEIYAQGRYTGTAGTKTMIWRISTTSGDISVGNQILNSTINGSTAAALEAVAYKVVFNVNSKSAQIYTTSAISTTGVYSSTGMGTASINTANAWYINLNMTDTSTADTVGYQGVIIKWNEA